MTDPLAFNILVQLIKNQILDLDDVEEIAKRLCDEGEDDAAIAAQGAYVEATAAPEKTEAEYRREQMVLVPRIHLGPQTDGGNTD